MKPNQRRSALNYAIYPDSATTGHPGWWQIFDPRRGLWLWQFTRFGISTSTKRPTKNEVAKHGARCAVKPGEQFRYVYVKRWTRRQGGWAPVVKRVVEVTMPEYKLVKRKPPKGSTHCPHCYPPAVRLLGGSK